MTKLHALGKKKYTFINDEFEITRKFVVILQDCYFCAIWFGANLFYFIVQYSMHIPQKIKRGCPQNIFKIKSDIYGTKSLSIPI